MFSGAAGGALSRPPTDLQQGVGRFPLYSLFPAAGNTASIHKVTESVFSTSVVQSPQRDLFGCPQQLLVTDRFSKKMDETKLGKTCVPEPLCCPGEQALTMMQPLTIKTEQVKRACNTCLTHSPKKMLHSDGGCSRTNPVAWLGQNLVQVKREPQQLHMSELVAVKLEQASPGNKPEPPPNIPASLNNGSIPVGIAVARQRVDAGLLTTFSQQKDTQQRLHDIGRLCDGAQAAMTLGVASAGPAPVWSHPPPAAQPLWQYPGGMSMDSMMVGGMGGFQLVREPSSGALLLLPAPAQPDLSHAVVWGSLPYPTAPLLLPPPHPAPAPPQLFSGDLLASTATLQHTHSTRLVTIAPAANPPPDKRKPMLQPLINPHALIKLEPEPPPDKQPSFAPEPPMHLYYNAEYPPELPCRSQATSPAAPPTPRPESVELPAHRDASNQTDHIEDEDEPPNQADEDERDVACVGVAHFPDEPQHETRPVAPPIDSAEESSSEGLAAVGGAVEKAIDAIERDETIDNSSSGGSNDLVIDTGQSSPPETRSRPLVDVSGLELLSNSIEQFERTTPKTAMSAVERAPLTVDTKCQVMSNILIKSSPKSPPRTDLEPNKRFEFPPAESAAPERSNLDGLGLLCALAEQRFMEEVEEGPSNASARTFIKSELLSPTDRDPSIESKKDRRRSPDGDSSGERRRKRSHDREERLRRKLEKMRRHRKEKENGSEIEAILKRVTACACGKSSCEHKTKVPSARDIVSAIEQGMRERLEDLQRQCNEKKAQLSALTTPLPPLSTGSTPSTPTPSPDSDRGSSQKRKVGRPRKVSSPDSTETIVAKKPKSKSGLVGYLIAKGKLKGGIVCSKGEFSKEDANRTSKVRPKLKAEPIVKVYSEEEDNEWGLDKSASSSMESLNEVRQKNKERVDRLVRKHSRDDLPELELAVRRASVSSDSDKERRKAKKRRKSLKCKIVSSDSLKETQPVVQKTSRCTLTEALLDSGPRVLTAMGGLFYAGAVSAVQAPDVYAITLDGERGNKPHILSREETLRDAILEVSPSSVSELPGGTRVCAYWSQQYRCLYPGTVAVCSPDPDPDPHPDRFVAVEFDDGDSGRIALEDIRFLEPNYPVVEYENPLFTLGKRRRNTSANSTDERKPRGPSASETPLDQPASVDALHRDHHRDRKKLKKHRKEKLKRLQPTEGDSNAEYVKKKKKKHKCCGEHCKHRKHHKKHHKKHRKRHHSSSKESNSSEEPQRKSSSDFGDSKSNEDSVDSNDRLSTLIAVEKSPEEKMKTVIKKAVLSKSVKLEFPALGLTPSEGKDNLKDSGIVMEDEPSTSTGDGVKKKVKRRTASSSSETLATGGHSKMAAFLPGGTLWRWAGPAYRRTARPRHKKLFYRAIQRGEDTLHVGEAAVFLSTGRPDRPYIGRLEALWEARGAMAVRVRWFYHPEECVGCVAALTYPGGLFESPHTDENDVQTISHKCEVLPLSAYKQRMGDDPHKYKCVYDNNDVYYLAGHYDPATQTRRCEPDIPLAETSS